ncbi:unnamed protein product [Cylindrotheca closterium]|uniref:Uncharacterized protein n=1 Tax=Cylindrotheca closterium TaxID=2856 RepID=A0AAD2CLJ3_9STRA|nr:unnamed protein product [Cylindrotheca closterium]
MPWQSVSSLFVVGGMFNVVAGLMGGIHYLSEGKSKELGMCENDFKYGMEKRDITYNKFAAEVRKSMN